MEKDNQLFFTKLSSNDPPKKILDGYDYLRSKSIDGDDVTVKFSEETKTYFAVYSDGNLKYRKKMDSQGTGSEKDQVFLNRDKQVIYVEEYNNNHAVYVMDQQSFMEIKFDINVFFHYPFIFYGYENNEIWLQNVDEPYNIKRHAFINTISAFDYTDPVYFQENKNNKEKNSLGLVLTYRNHHKIAEFEFVSSAGKYYA